MFRTIGLYAVLGLGSLMAACTEAVDEGAIIDEDALSVTEQAVGSCGTHGNYFDGAKNGVGSGVYRRGARVDAIVRNTALCTGDPSIANFSAGWAMLTGDIAPSDGWAQIGFEVDKANGNTWFLQSLRDSSKGPHTEFWGNPGGGTQKRFVVTRESDGFIHLKLCDFATGNNCTTYHVTSFDPLNAWSNADTQYFGETGYFADQMLGSEANPFWFVSPQGKHADDNWYDDNLDHPGADSSHYKFAWQWGQTFSIWDDR